LISVTIKDQPQKLGDVARQFAMADALNGKPAIAGTGVLGPDHLLAAGSVAVGLCGEISSATIFASAPP